jgi:hypothetical protein
MSSIVSTDSIFCRRRHHPLIRFTIWVSTQLRKTAPARKACQRSLVGIVLLVLINGFATSRTKSNVNPPSAVPDVTETGT